MRVQPIWIELLTNNIGKHGLRASTTFRLERWRALCSGVIEAAGTTFLLLIVTRFYESGPMSKALVASGGSVGLLLTPLVVHLAERSRWPVARLAAVLAFAGALSFLVMGMFPFLPVFVVGSIVTLAAASGIVPLLTQIYQDNYPEQQRGKMFSQTIMLRIAAAVVFSEFAGRFLDGGMPRANLLLLVFAAAFGGSAWCLRRCPSEPLAQSVGGHPFRSLRYAQTDKLFRHTLICWMLMGFGNLMMLPLRIEYLANPRYGLAFSTGEIAFLVGVIPNAARLMASPLWGWLFDRMNFFALRATLNLGFAVGIVSFFTSDSVAGLVAGASIYGISTAGGDVAWGLWVTKFAPPDRVAAYMSVHTFFTGVRGVIAPLLAFQLAGILSMEILGAFCASLIVLSALMLSGEIKSAPRGRKTAALVEEVSE